MGVSIVHGGVEYSVVLYIFHGGCVEVSMAVSIVHGGVE